MKKKSTQINLLSHFKLLISILVLLPFHQQARDLRAKSIESENKMSSLSGKCSDFFTELKKKENPLTQYRTAFGPSRMQSSGSLRDSVYYWAWDSVAVFLCMMRIITKQIIGVKAGMVTHG